MLKSEESERAKSSHYLSSLLSSALKFGAAAQSRAILDELPLLLRQELACAMNTCLFAQARTQPLPKQNKRLVVLIIMAVIITDSLDLWVILNLFS